MHDDSPDVGTSDDDDDNDVSCCHPAGLLFWGVQTFESRIPILSSSNPLRVSTAQRKLVSLYYSVGGMVASLLLAVEVHAVKGNIGYEEAEEDNDESSSLGGGKR
jgi:hypothetical protein